MASDNTKYTTKIPNGSSVEYRGYQPRRPADVEDVPPEKLDPPSGVTTIAHTTGSSVETIPQSSETDLGGGGSN